MVGRQCILGNGKRHIVEKLYTLECSPILVKCLYLRSIVQHGRTKIESFIPFSLHSFDRHFSFPFILLVIIVHQCAFLSIYHRLECSDSIHVELVSSHPRVMIVISYLSYVMKRSLKYKNHT